MKKFLWIILAVIIVLLNASVAQAGEIYFELYHGESREITIPISLTITFSYQCTPKGAVYVSNKVFKGGSGNNLTMELPAGKHRFRTEGSGEAYSTLTVHYEVEHEGGFELKSTGSDSGEKKTSKKFIYATTIKYEVEISEERNGNSYAFVANRKITSTSSGSFEVGPKNYDFIADFEESAHSGYVKLFVYYIEHRPQDEIELIIDNLPNNGYIDNPVLIH